MVEDQGGLTVGILTQPQVHSGEMSCWKFLVGPSTYNAFVLDEVKEIAGVILVAQRKGASFMRLNEGFFVRESNVRVLIEQGLKNLGRCSSQFNDLINVLRLEFHDAAVLP